MLLLLLDIFLSLYNLQPAGQLPSGNTYPILGGNMVRSEFLLCLLVKETIVHTSVYKTQVGLFFRDCRLLAFFFFFFLFFTVINTPPPFFSYFFSPCRVNLTCLTECFSQIQHKNKCTTPAPKRL